MARPFHCSVVTPEQAVLDAEVTYANVPAHDGQSGFLFNRAPIVMKLGNGVLKLDLADGGKRAYQLSGGFAQMHNNRLTIISESAKPVGE